MIFLGFTTNFTSLFPTKLTKAFRNEQSQRPCRPGEWAASPCGANGPGYKQPAHAGANGPGGEQLRAAQRGAQAAQANRPGGRAHTDGPADMATEILWNGPVRYP